ncbi:MAG: hypothetical protein ACP5OP_08275, partial [Leptospirillia bacterium]
MMIDRLSRGLMERLASRLQGTVPRSPPDNHALSGDCPLCRWIASLRETVSSSGREENFPLPISHRHFHLALEEARSFGEGAPPLGARQICEKVRFYRFSCFQCVRRGAC